MDAGTHCRREVASYCMDSTDLATRANAGTQEYLETAIAHLALIDDDTCLRTVRLHCHFASIFLQLFLTSHTAYGASQSSDTL